MNFTKRRKIKFGRSGLEQKIKEDLEKRGIKYEYESIKLTYTKRICQHCGGVVDTGVYTPDFIIARSSGIRLILEGKGYFDSADRSKMQRVKHDNPTEDIRLVFQRDQPIRKGSKTLYSQWAIKNGFKYCIGHSIPEEWLK